MGLVNEAIDTLKKRMPFKITIERDAEDKENLTISSIADKDGNDVEIKLYHSVNANIKIKVVNIDSVDNATNVEANAENTEALNTTEENN